MRQTILWTSVLAGLAGCGGGSSNGGSGSNTQPPQSAPPVIDTGYFKGLTVRGLGYLSGNQSGVTNEHGRFFYERGKPVTFFVGAVDSLKIATLDPKQITTLMQLPEAHRIIAMRVLLMLDEDGNPQDGVTLSASLQARAVQWPRIDLATANSAVLPQIQSDAHSADGAPHLLSSPETATALLEAAVRCTYTGVFRGSFKPTGTISGAGPEDRQGLLVFAVTPSQGGVYGRGYIGAAEGQWAPFMYIEDPGPLPLTDPHFTGGARVVHSGTFRSQNEVEGSWIISPDDTGSLFASRIDNSFPTLRRFVSAVLDEADLSRVLLFMLEMDFAGRIQISFDEGVEDGGELSGRQDGALIEASSSSAYGPARWRFSATVTSDGGIAGVLQDLERGRSYPIALESAASCVM